MNPQIDPREALKTFARAIAPLAKVAMSRDIWFSLSWMNLPDNEKRAFAQRHHEELLELLKREE